MKKKKKNKFTSTFFKIYALSIPTIISLCWLYAAIESKDYVLILMCVPFWVLIFGLFFKFKELDKKSQSLVEIKESIKNYSEDIVINLNEYRKPYEAVVKDGKQTTEEGKFLEINKSNELFKNGKHTVGTIVEIIDNIEYDIVSDLDRFSGDVFLIVEFMNDKGEKYKVKTPAISKNLYNYIKVGQKVDVYYDDSVKKEAYRFLCN